MIAAHTDNSAIEAINSDISRRIFTDPLSIS